MISLDVMLWVFIILFAFIGALRGWAKELLVTASIILAFFAMVVFENFIPFFKELFTTSTPQTVFWVRTVIIGALVVFGYQTPRFPRLAESGRFMRNMLQDTLLGLLFGAINGYLLFGTLWYYLDASNYPFPFIIRPDAVTAIGQQALAWIHRLPPEWLMTTPTIYIAVVICFIFVVVVII